MPLTIPNTISNGITADGNEIGANFTAIQAWADSTDAGVEGVIPPGAITMFGAAAAPAGFLLCDGTAVSRATYADLFTTIGTVYGVGDGSTTFNLPNFASRFPRGGTPGSTGGSADAVVVQHNHTASSGNQSTSHTHNPNLSVDIDHDHGSFNATSGNQSASHTHGAGSYTAASVGGTDYLYTQSVVTNANVGSSGSFPSIVDDIANHTHTITGTSASQSASHTHTTSINVPNYNVANRSVQGTLGNQSASHSHTITVNNDGVSGTDKNLPPYLNVQFIIKY